MLLPRLDLHLPYLVCNNTFFQSRVHLNSEALSLLQIPIDLHDKEFLPILQEEPLPPLALVSFTEEEQVGVLVFMSGLYLGEK